MARALGGGGNEANLLERPLCFHECDVHTGIQEYVWCPPNLSPRCNQKLLVIDDKIKPCHAHRIGEWSSRRSAASASLPLLTAETVRNTPASRLHPSPRPPQPILAHTIYLGTHNTCTCACACACACPPLSRHSPATLPPLPPLSRQSPTALFVYVVDGTQGWSISCGCGH